MDRNNANDMFTDDVKNAITTGRAENIRKAFEQQPSSETTIAISARVSAREFMTREKAALAKLIEEVDKTQDCESYMRRHINELDDNYHTLLEVPYGLAPRNDKYQDEVSDKNLRGDEPLRIMIDSMSDEGVVNFANHLAQMPLERLVPPEQIADWMWDEVRMATVERLWEVVNDYRVDGATESVKRAFHYEVNSVLDDLNQKIPGAMLL